MSRPTFPPKPAAQSILPILGPAVARARKLKPHERPGSNAEVVEDIGRKLSLPAGLLDEMRQHARRRDEGE